MCFKAYKVSEGDISKHNHSLEKDNSLYTVFWKKEVGRKDIIVANIEYFEKYKLTLDTEDFYF